MYTQYRKDEQYVSILQIVWPFDVDALFHLNVHFDNWNIIKQQYS